MYVLGIDIGGTWTRTGFVRPDGAVESFERILSSEVFGEDENTDTFVHYIKQRISQKKVKAVAIGVPATVNKERTRVLSATFLHALDGLDIVALLESIFHVPVYLERDVNFLLTKDLKEKNLYGLSCVAAIYYGTGIGNAVYINGSLLIGRHGVAAELGHIPLYQNNRVCGCGNTGCVESIACGKSLQAIHAEKYAAEDINTIFSHYSQDTDLQSFIDILALTAATEINILDPDAVIVGGGLPAMANFPRDKWEEGVYKYVRKPLPAEDLNFIYTGDSQESGVIGGGIYAWNKLLR